MAEQPIKKSKGKPSDWELESAFDLAAGLQDLIDTPPFKEASDEKGESVTSGTRLPLWLHRRVVKLREMEGSPYEVNSDVLRDAVYVGLQILHMRYKISPDWGVETKMAAVVDASGALRRLKDQFDMLVGGLEQLCEGGDEDQAAHRLSDYILAAGELENKWHREKVFRMLRENRTIKEVTRLCPRNVQKLISGGENANTR